MAGLPECTSDGSNDIELQACFTKARDDEKPWRYLGYRAFTEYVTSDPDCFVVRRFDKLFARVALNFQDHLSKLEEDMEVLDKRYMETDVNNGTIRDDMHDRKELIHRASQALKVYYDMLASYSGLGYRKPAQNRAIQNVKNWFTNHPSAIVKEEARFVEENDLMSVASIEHSPIRQLFVEWAVLRTKCLYPLFRKEPPKELNPVDQSTSYYVSNKRIDLLSQIAIFMTGSLMLVAPLWILQALSTLRERLVVITVFILIFLALLASSALGRPLEVLTLTAGYSAILVVFLQFGSSSV